MKNVKKIITLVTASVSCSLLIPLQVHAAPFNNEEFEFIQPDESKVKVIASGDEFYQQVESPDGYTLVRNNDGWICYADVNEDGTELVATDKVYDGTDKNEPENVEKHLKITNESAQKKIKENREKASDSDKVFRSAIYTLGKPYWVRGDIKGLTVLVDFPDEKSNVSLSEVDNFFNQQGYNGYSNNGSIRDYFYDISNKKLNYTNKVVGYYTAKYNKSHYDGAQINTNTSRELVTEILDWLKSSGINTDDITRTNDNSYKILNVLYAGKCNSGWTNGLWPCRFRCNYDGKVQNFEISDIGDELSIGTICHETGHALLDYPDLYQFDGNKASIVGYYSLMSYGGHAGNEKNPAPPDPYLRNELSEFNNDKDITGNSSSFPFYLNSTGDGTQDVYKIRNTSDSGEYYLIENIEKKGRYADMPDDGVIIWHVNTSGNNKYPVNSKYLISVVEADGYDALKTNRYYRGGSGDLFGNDKDFDDDTIPSAKWYDGSSCGFKIANIKKGSVATFLKEK